jgi:ABC-type multidrug transport system fused ATPase/permease subunit
MLYKKYTCAHHDSYACLSSSHSQQCTRASSSRYDTCGYRSGFPSDKQQVEGVATIRSFGWEKEIENENIVYLDRSQKPSYILFCLQRWLNIVLDLMVAAIATGLVTLAVLLRGTTTAAQIGMVLNIVLVANTTLLSLVESWTNLEISLGAMYASSLCPIALCFYLSLRYLPSLLCVCSPSGSSRLKHLEAETPKEDKPGEDYVPAETWPSSGAVEIDNVTVAYK